MEHQVANQVIAIWSIPRHTPSVNKPSRASNGTRSRNGHFNHQGIAMCCLMLLRHPKAQFSNNDAICVSSGVLCLRLCNIAVPIFFLRRKNPVFIYYCIIYIYIYLPQLKAKVNNRAPKNQCPRTLQMQNLLCFLSSLACLPMRHFSVFLPSDGLHIS